MAAPVVASNSNAVYQDISVSTSLTITKPTGTASGDLLVAQIVWDVSTGNPTAPSGWTLLNKSSQFDGGVQMSQAIYYKEAGGSEPSNYTWTINASATTGCGGIARVTGADNTAVSDWAANSGTTSPAVCPAVAGSFTDYRTLRFSCNGDYQDPNPSFGVMWNGNNPDFNSCSLAANFDSDTDGTVNTENHSLDGDSPWVTHSFVLQAPAAVTQIGDISISLGAVF